MAEAPAAELRMVPVGDLRPFEGNPRTISDEGLEKLRRSIERFGFVAPVIAQEGSMLVVAGHQRLRAAEAAGLAEVPVIVKPMSDEEARAYNVADNRLAEDSDWDTSALASLLAELEEADGGALRSVGLSEDELKELLWLDTVEFPEYGEDAADPVPMTTCPKCGHEFPV